ncbi:hypothetical protein KCU98_g7861, partial [Aureobasidium melanogenum]
MGYRAMRRRSVFASIRSSQLITSCWQKRSKRTKHTAAGIPTWSPTVVLICRSTAYVWQSGRDAQFSADYGQTNEVVKHEPILREIIADYAP